MHILLAEDDRIIADGLVRTLRKSGYAVDHVTNGSDADAALLSQQFDLLILDLGLPRLNGIEVLKRLRARKSPLPVLILTAQDGLEDRVRGLDVGADDYLTKPFSMNELLARLRAVMRRIRPGLADDKIVIGDITMDRVSHRVHRGSRDVHLGPTEFRILDHLMQHPGRVFSREQLLDAVWGSDVYVEARTVDVHIGRLRKALMVGEESDPIRTVRSAGYALDIETA